MATLRGFRCVRNDYSTLSTYTEAEDPALVTESGTVSDAVTSRPGTTAAEKARRPKGRSPNSSVGRLSADHVIALPA